MHFLFESKSILLVVFSGLFLSTGCYIRPKFVPTVESSKDFKVLFEEEQSQPEATRPLPEEVENSPLSVSPAESTSVDSSTSN